MKRNGKVFGVFWLIDLVGGVEDVSCSENHALNREKTVGIEWCS